MARATSLSCGTCKLFTHILDPGWQVTLCTNWGVSRWACLPEERDPWEHLSASHPSECIVHLAQLLFFILRPKPALRGICSSIFDHFSTCLPAAHDSWGMWLQRHDRPPPQRWALIPAAALPVSAFLADGRSMAFTARTRHRTPQIKEPGMKWTETLLWAQPWLGALVWLHDWG